MTEVSPMKAFMTAAFSSLAVLILAVPAAGTATAHGAHKYRDGHVVGHVRRKYKVRRDRRSYRRRDRAIFAHEVDLSRPGGPERFFELLSEENR